MWFWLYLRRLGLSELLKCVTLSFSWNQEKNSAIVILNSSPSPLPWNSIQAPALWKLPLDQGVHLVWYWIQATFSTSLGCFLCNEFSNLFSLSNCEYLQGPGTLSGRLQKQQCFLHWIVVKIKWINIFKELITVTHTKHTINISHYHSILKTILRCRKREIVTHILQLRKLSLNRLNDYSGSYNW